MSNEDTWRREPFEADGSRPLLAYAVFGEFQGIPQVSLSRHRSRGVPSGVELTLLRRGEHDAALAELCSGPLWGKLPNEQPDVAQAIERASACVVLEGEPEDASDLLYLRDAVGVVAALLEQGGVAVCDLLPGMWFDAPTWLNVFFEHGESRSLRHVKIWISEEGDPQRSWFHTRGMRKFGRPDLSVHCVGKALEPTVLELIQRFVSMQALGTRVEHGHEIVMAGLPADGRVMHAGYLDDPDFNNVHLECTWPSGSDLSCSR